MSEWACVLLLSLLMKLISLVLLVSLAEMLWAGPVNRLCADSGLERLWFYAPDMSADGEKDLCQEPASEIPPALVQAIQDQKEVQSKVTQLFDTDPAQALPRGLRLIMQWVISGADGSYDHPDLDKPDDRTISVSNGSTDERILNKPVLAHELTHWLLDTPNPKIPAALRSVNTSGLWSESIPDTVALATYSQVSTVQPDIEPCLNIRRFDAPITFKQTKGFFSHSAFFHQRKACCEKVDADPKASAASQAVCSDFYESNVRALTELKPLDKSPFDAKEAARSLRSYNTYQIGMPFNSFLIELSKKLGINAPAIFLKTAKNIPERKFSCSMPGASQSVVVEAYSMLDVFKDLRAGLTSSQQKVYDQLAHDFGLEALDAMEPADMNSRIEAAAIAAFLHGRPGQASVLGPKDPCRSILEAKGIILSTLPKQCQIKITAMRSAESCERSVGPQK